MWAIICALCIIIVVYLYYNYSTREGFASGNVNWFGETVNTVPQNAEAIRSDGKIDIYLSAMDMQTLPSVGPEVYIIQCDKPIAYTDIENILGLYDGAKLATLNQLRESVKLGFSSCQYGYIEHLSSTITNNVLTVANAGKLHEVNYCGGVGLSANTDFDNGFVHLISEIAKPNGDNFSKSIYAYGVKPPANEPPRYYNKSETRIETRIAPFNNYTPGWWFARRPPSNTEVFVVYDVSGGLVKIDDNFTLPMAIANAFNCKIPNIAILRDMIRTTTPSTGSLSEKVYPHWDISGCSSNDDPLRVITPLSEQAQMPTSSSSATQFTPKLNIVSYPRATPDLAVKGVLLHGPKPSFDKRDVTVDGRTFRAEYYNTIRNVWSKYDAVQYKCKTPSITITTGMTYGSYAKSFVSILETPGSSKKVTTKITGTVDGNRAYPGCPSSCNACERTSEPYYDARPALDINKYDNWKDQHVESGKDDPRVLYDQIPLSGSINAEKTSTAIRLVNACREAGGLVVLNINETNQLKGCPTDSWCCSPNKDISIALPLSQRDPMAATLGKTCEPAEEECDTAPSPAPFENDAYRLSKDGRRSRISKDVKSQFCKSKSASIRTLAQEQRSTKLLRRLVNADKR